jgi:hypothetical protein
MRPGDSYNATDTDKGPMRYNLRRILLRKSKRPTIRAGYPEANQGYLQPMKSRETLQMEFLYFCPAKEGC